MLHRVARALASLRRMPRCQRPTPRGVASTRAVAAATHSARFHSRAAAGVARAGDSASGLASHPPPRDTDVVVVGAGVIGLSAAQHLATTHGLRVVVVDRDSPLTNTSALSSECYRNLWLDRDMVALTNRSIDLTQRAAAQQPAVGLTQRGYAFVTSDAAQVATLMERARTASEFGAGPVRIHTNTSAPYDPTAPMADGIDMVMGSAAIARAFPYVDASNAQCVLHARRAGWLSAHQLGVHYLERATRTGRVQVVRGHVCGATRDTGTGAVTGVDVCDTDRADDDSAAAAGRRPVWHIRAPRVLLCAGPWLPQLLPVFSGDGRTVPRWASRVRNEMHAKIVFRDTLRVLPRTAPLLIAHDSTSLHWSQDERALITEANSSGAGGVDGDDVRDLLNAFPSGLHFRPIGGADANAVLLLWEFVHSGEVHVPSRLWEAGYADPRHTTPSLAPDAAADAGRSGWLRFNDMYAELALRGAVSLVPGFRRYFDAPSDGTAAALSAGAVTVDGGLYTQTPSHRPLIGPLRDATTDVDSDARAKAATVMAGVYVCGGLSGYGVMTSAAAGELAAQWVATGRGGDAPYANAFVPSQADAPSHGRPLQI